MIFSELTQLVCGGIQFQFILISFPLQLTFHGCCEWSLTDTHSSPPWAYLASGNPGQDQCLQEHSWRWLRKPPHPDDQIHDL